MLRRGLRDALLECAEHLLHLLVHDRLQDALAYGEDGPLRWFPGRVAVTEAADASGFPKPSYALASADSDLLDLAGLTAGYSAFYALTDTANADVGGSQPALAYFDGDPFPADDQLADGEDTLHERIKVVERRLLAEVVAAVATRGVVSDGRKAVIPSDRT